MDDWTSGYVADVGYTYGYYAELNPLNSKLALLSAGVASPEIKYGCELGFGQGVSVNIHAAAGAAQWWGTDFNPAQAGFARELAQASGSGTMLSDEAFEEFCRRPDLPEMDYIGLHGIWSWISDQNRAVIVDFARQKLKVGGVFYISYNAQPGWASAVPIRDLLTEHAEVMGVQGHGIVSRIDAALAFADKLMASNPRYLKANPQVAERLKLMATQDRRYLAHEYFNRDWEPMSFAKMAGWLGSAKLNYACSANVLEHLDALNLSPDQQAILKDIPDPMFRETVRDFCVNQQFRKDLWVKGVRKISRLQQKEIWEEQQFVLLKSPGEVQLTLGSGPGGGSKLTESIYNPVIDAMADFKPVSMRELAGRVQAKGVNPPAVVQALLVLSSKGDVHAVQPQAAIAQARPDAQRLNLHLMAASRSSNQVGYFASPVTGGGIPVQRFHQLFMLARLRGQKTPGEWATFVWRDLASQGQRVSRDGKALEAPEENVRELTRLANEFAEKRLPVLDALQLVGPAA